MGSAVSLGSGAGLRGLSAARAGRGVRYGRLVSRADGLGFRPSRALGDGCYVQQPEGTRAPSEAAAALLGILTVPGFLGWPMISIIYYSGRFRCANIFMLALCLPLSPRCYLCWPPLQDKAEFTILLCKQADVNLPWYVKKLILIGHSHKRKALLLKLRMYI